MNDFDRFLELELREMLDPVVAVQPPRRLGLAEASRRILTLEIPVADYASEAVPVEPAAVTVPIAPAAQV